MKIIQKKEINKKHLKNQVKNEKLLLESFDNPFIVKLRYSFQTSSKLYLVMDFMQGGFDLYIPLFFDKIFYFFS